MFESGVPWIDCQVYTDHLARFGAKEIPRSEYLKMLTVALKDLSWQSKISWNAVWARSSAV